MRIPTTLLGQSGCRLAFPTGIIYIDPYLSNSVQELDAPDLDRLVPIARQPNKIFDADLVLITHAHMDHCDPKTLPMLAEASPQAIFMGPNTVITVLRDWGIPPDRLVLASENWVEVFPNLRVHAIPAAHPEIERDTAEHLIAVGYLLSYLDKKIYIAGDTFARQQIIDILNELGPIHTAFLPVNEHNFFRSRRGIIGNMSIHEAFQFAEEIKVEQVVAVHWDMFSVNSVDPEEIRFIHQRRMPSFKLLLSPSSINLEDISVSIIIRTLNEQRYLDQLLTAISQQKKEDINCEVVLVDSGSTDDTLKIAKRHGCQIVHIRREEFSFGRSLNKGCEVAHGDIFIITSGHCVPEDADWLQKLCRPILDGRAQYVYGKQIGGPQSHFSEKRIFEKYFTDQSMVPQEGAYCNNANSAIDKSIWEKYRFDEDLTGLEDMDLGQRLLKDGGKLAYVSDAVVSHHHFESWAQVRRRFEREAIALHKIMPQFHVTLFDTFRYFSTSVLRDWSYAKLEKVKPRLVDIVHYRWNQYWGTFKGNRQHRKLSHYEKEQYFYSEKI